ncbi:HupE/UreJ family protein [Sessilibacter sp. MAH2]
MNKNNTGLIGLTTFLFLLLFSLNSFAHFNPIVNRSFHVVFNPSQSVQVYARIPLPLLIIHPQWGGIDSGEALPWTESKLVDSQWRYYLDNDTIDSHWGEFTEFVLEAYSINTISGTDLKPYVKEISVHSEHYNRGFSTFESATSAFDGRNNITFADDKEVFDAVVDVYFEINSVNARQDFIIESQQGKDLGIENRLFNHVSFYERDSAGDTQIIDTQHNLGLLSESYHFERPIVDKIATAVYHGIEHIVLGWDHLLFVILLVLVSVSVKQVIQRATLFTIGHSITLTMGVFGVVPAVDWFIPLIESLIAASILLAGVFILLNQSSRFNLKVCFVLGLVHGFGFSFVLKEGIFQQQSIDYFNLFGINLGIEVGQVLIYLVAFPLLYLMQKYCTVNTLLARKAMVIPCVFISGYWLVLRLFETSEFVL